MHWTRGVIAPLAVAALGTLTSAQEVGSPVPALELEGLSNTEAGSYDEMLGRAVLLEFFAYW